MVSIQFVAPDPRYTIQSSSALIQSIQLSSFPIVRSHFGMSQTLTDGNNQGEEGSYICYVDGSFKEPNMGGAAYLLEKQGQLIRYEFLSKNDVVSSFQMEVIALLTAIQAAISMGITHCVFFLDAEVLAVTFKMKPRLEQIQVTDWMVYVELMQIAILLLNQPGFSCQYIPREDNHKANQLANSTRILQTSYVGHTYPLIIRS